jgi:hypothetical protein
VDDRITDDAAAACDACDVDDHITDDDAAAMMIDEQGGQVVEEEDKLELTGWITQTKLFILCQAFVGAS